MVEVLKLDEGDILIVIQSLNQCKEALQDLFVEHRATCSDCSEEQKCFRFHEMEVTIFVYRDLIDRFHKAL